MIKSDVKAYRIFTLINRIEFILYVLPINRTYGNHYGAESFISL